MITFAGPRARYGARYLDRTHPGWYDEIDLGILDLSYDELCVFGQLHGSFRKAEPLLPRRVRQAFHSFTGYREEEQYAALDVEWTKQIMNRRVQALAVNDVTEEKELANVR